MRLIHVADLHLESAMESNLSSDKARLRREELLDRFSDLVCYGEEHQVDAILIAGDLFDKTHIRKAARSRVLEEIREHTNITFFYLQGNHDRSDFLQDVHLEEIPNLKLFDANQWSSYELGDVVITGREITAENAKTFTMNLVLDSANCNIVMLHGQESEYQGKDKTEIIPLGDLRGKYIDYLALGHIHSYKKERLDDRGEYCYPGCLEGRGFDECGEKGFVLLEILEGKVESQFIPFAKRRLHEVEVELTEEDDMPSVLGKIKEKVESISEEDFIKIVLTGNTHVDFDVDLSRILREFGEKYFFVKVYDHSTIKVHYEDFINDKSLKGEFVRLMEQQEMDEMKKSLIVEIGMKALMGEEL
ncbi:MAG: metallophosphoesterase family protein [Lachnospiraceae bacterium]|nr:metallophosphoesterase family protein [Lachnospiraceae bacterium]